MTQLKQLLGAIAAEHLFIPTLDTRRSDDLDFHHVSVWAVESALNAAFEAGRKTADSEEFDVNRHVRELLAKHHSIATIWCIDDVRGVRPHLNEDQAWEVLQQVDDIHDAVFGITWTSLETVADDLYPAPDDEKET